MTEVAVNSNTGRVFGISPSLDSFYYDQSAITYSTFTTSVQNAHLAHLAASATFSEEFLTFPDDDIVRVLTEAGVVKDIAVGDYPLFVFPYDAVSRAYASNYGADTVSVINMSTNAVASTISLSSGCGPTKSINMAVSGTNYVYVLCQDSDSVEVITQSTGAVGTPISLRF
jgi:YVTN family beta-propeller protein